MLWDEWHKGFEAQISAAIASHSRWKHDLGVAIETSEADWTPAFVADCSACEFGAWLNCMPDGLRDDAFDNVYRVHRNFHLEAAEVLRLALEGKREEGLAGIGAGSAYAKASVDLIVALAGWRSHHKNEFRDGDEMG